ncbi:hypothetical protein XENOCAPTIV_005150, partial [Xenoophorus captivus]
LGTHGFLLAALSLVPTRVCCSSAEVPDVPKIAAYFGTKTRYEEVKPNVLRDPLTVNTSVLRPPPGQLVRKGRDDLRFLAQRLATLFPSLLSEENLRKRRIRFVTSSKHRCVSSVEAFQEGLQQHWGCHGDNYHCCHRCHRKAFWERVKTKLLTSVPTDNAPGYSHSVDDELMRFFELCRGYVEGVENNRTALLEVEKFKHGKEMEAVRRRIAEKLGLSLHLLTPAVSSSITSSGPWTKPAVLAGRSFRTSRIIPYAANLLFVLYDCQRGPRLQLLVNETPLRFPDLQTDDTPLYRDVRATYRHLLDGCDFRRVCEGRVEGRGPNTEL